MTSPSDIAGLSESKPLRRDYLEMMRAHVDEGGQLSHRNGLDLLAEVERQNTALDSLTARVKELEVEADKYCKWWREERDRATRAEQQRDEAYERAAKIVEAPSLFVEWPDTKSIAAAIRRLASGPEGGEKPQESKP